MNSPDPSQPMTATVAVESCSACGGPLSAKRIIMDGRTYHEGCVRRSSPVSETHCVDCKIALTADERRYYEHRCEQCERKLWDRLEETERRSWKCGARQRHIGPEVQDCDWPVCGCDPYASKVLDAIEESGFEIVRKQSRGLAQKPKDCPQMARGEQWCVWPKCDCAQRPAEGAFEEWFDSHFLDPDGGSSHLPDWLKDDLRLAWDAALSHSSTNCEGKL